MSAPSLAHTQRLLWKLITAPEGAAAGLARLDAADRVVAASAVRGDQRLSGLERVDVYADMYFYRIRDCLQADFAAVCAVVGAANFHNLITDYLIEHPPSHFSLRYAGQHLPVFVGRHRLVTHWPYLGELAALEWAILEAFDAADALPVEAAALAGVPPDQWPDIHFHLTPTLRLLTLRWPVHEIWERTQHGDPPCQLSPGPTWLRVWRQDLRVFHRAIGPAEAAALAAIAAGAPFAEVCERILESEEAADGADHVFQLVGEWLANGLLTGFVA